MKEHREHPIRAALLVLAASVLIVVGIGPARAQVDLPVDEPTVPTPVEGSDASDPSGASVAQAGTVLEGLFRLGAGQCGSGAGVEAGSWFRMLDPGGGYVENNDSPCADKTWTPLSPGTDGGLITGEYQPHPDPAFASNGDSRADRIMEPEPFFGVRFSAATNPTDPQTGVEVEPPRIAHDGSGGLDGDLRAWAAAWSNQHFNQGAPKPDGSMPDGTEGPDGTYDAGNGAYSIDWSSRIQGGPFNNFSGIWHLEGTFESEGPATAGGSGSGAGTDDAGTGAAGSTASAPAGGGPGGRLSRTGGAPAAGWALVVGAAGLLGSRIARRRVG